MEVEIQSEDGLSRRLWRFNNLNGGVRTDMNLVAYQEQSRASKRHKFKSDASWHSYSHDMRGVMNKLPKPTEIPDEVMRDALRQMNIYFRIGAGYDAEQAGHFSLLEGTAF